MKFFCKTFAFLLAFIFVFSCFAGCDDINITINSPSSTTVTSGESTTTSNWEDGWDEDDEVVSTTAATTPSNTPSDNNTQIKPNNPSKPSDPSNTAELPDMNWRGATFCVLGQEGVNFEIARDERPDDVVGQAVYERNVALANKYNFFVLETLVAFPYDEMSVRYAAGEDFYDAVIYTPQYAARHAAEGYLLDLNSLPYTNLSHPSWNQSANEQLTIAGKTFFTVSDFMLTAKERSFVLHYNRELAIGAGKGYLENMVDNNTWTFDNFNSLVTEFSGDGNNDGKSGSAEDNYGVVCESIGSYSLFLYGGGFRLSNNVDGVVTMAGAGRDITQILERSASFALNNNVTYYPDLHHKDPQFGGNAYGSEMDIFTSGRALFLSAFLGTTDDIIERADFEHAYMPYPKYDDKQENYYTMVNDIAPTVISVPYSVADTEKSGFMLQAITEESTTTTYNAYFEDKCKLQNSIDQRSADMLDVILENVVFDIAYIYDLGQLRNYLVFELPKNQAYNRYDKTYNNRATVAESKLAEITAAYSAE